VAVRSNSAAGSPSFTQQASWFDDRKKVERAIPMMDATEALRHIQTLAFNALQSEDVESLQRTLRGILRRHCRRRASV
jgi:hypothetical protein